MTKPSRFSFSLLRLMLSIAAVGIVLAIGRWIDAPPLPILITATAVGLLMLVIRVGHAEAVILEGLCAFFGIAAAGCLMPVSYFVRQERLDYGPIDYGPIIYVVSGAFAGWFVGGVWARWLWRASERRGRRKTPKADESHGRSPDDADRGRDETNDPAL